MLISDFRCSGIACRLATIEGYLIQVPVIAIFTKMDTLGNSASNELILDDVPYAKTKEQAPARGNDIQK